MSSWLRKTIASWRQTDKSQQIQRTATEKSKDTQYVTDLWYCSKNHILCYTWFRAGLKIPWHKEKLYVYFTLNETEFEFMPSCVWQNAVLIGWWKKIEFSCMYLWTPIWSTPKILQGWMTSLSPSSSMCFLSSCATLLSFERWDSLQWTVADKLFI